MKTRKNELWLTLVIIAIAGLIALLTACSDMIGIGNGHSSSADSSSEDSSSLSAPQGLNAYPESTSSIYLSWYPVGGANYYRIYRSTYEWGGYYFIDSPYNEYYYDNYLDSGTTYYYKVSAVDYSGHEGALSSYAYATTY